MTSKTVNSAKKTSQVAALETSTDEQVLLTPDKPLRVLITRPKAKAQQLALLLSQQGIVNTSQSLFDYQSNASAHDRSRHRSQPSASESSQTSCRDTPRAQ